MSLEHYHSAELDESTLHSVRQLEAELGVVLVAVEPDPKPARLDEAQLSRVQALEQLTGKVLLAYSSEAGQSQRDA